MSDPTDLPRVPDDRIQPIRRKVSELKPGERVALDAILQLSVDEAGHAWVDASTLVHPVPVVSGLTLQAERTEAGFILWLDKKVQLGRGRRCKSPDYIPVVELRDAPERRN